MADLKSVAIADSSVKLRWREPYTTDGVDTAMLAHPAGVYRGFWIANDAPAATQAFRLLAASPNYALSDAGHVAGVDADQFAMHADPTAGFELAVRESAAITVDLAGVAGLWPNVADADLFVWIDVDYASNVPTVANYIVSDADPRVGDPTAVVIGVIHLPAGSMTIDFTGTSRVYYRTAPGVRTEPTPTARLRAQDFVAGDQPWGLFRGEDAYLLPTFAEKTAMGAAHSPSLGNHFVTEDDTTRLWFAEPTIATVTVGAAHNYVDLDFATYGAFYVGKGAVGTAGWYFDVREPNEVQPWRWDIYPQDARRITIAAICKFGGAVVVNPAVDADAQGFWSSGVRIYFSETYNAGGATTCDIWYGKKVRYYQFNQAPALALANGFRRRDGHADTTGATRLWTPARGEIRPDITVSQQLYKALRASRGTNSPQVGEYFIASKLYLPTTAEAQPCSETNETLVSSAEWPIQLAYGFNDQGAVDGLVGGERFLLKSMTSGGKQQVGRYIIQDDTGYDSGSAAMIDVAQNLVDSGVFAGPGASDWRIVSMCSIGTHLFVRAMADAGGAMMWHALIAYSIADRTQLWAAPAKLNPGGLVAHSSYDDEDANGLHVIVANTTTLAVNMTWNEAKVAGDPVVATYAIADGSLLGFGFGNADGLAWADSYAAGPMCSDGTDIYFTIRPTASNDIYAVAQCRIANPATVQPSAVINELDMLDWNPDAGGLPPMYPSNPRSLVFDGVLVWLSTLFCVAAVVPAPGILSPVAEYFMLKPIATTQAHAFGPMAFDGRYLWMGMADVQNPALLETIHWCHMVRINPATLEIVLDNSGGYRTAGDVRYLFTYENRWALDVPHPFLASPPAPSSYIHWGAYGGSERIPFGNIVYDGESMWWIKALWYHGGMGGDSTHWTYTMQRFPNVHGI